MERIGSRLREKHNSSIRRRFRPLGDDLTTHHADISIHQQLALERGGSCQRRAESLIVLTGRQPAHDSVASCLGHHPSRSRSTGTETAFSAPSPRRSRFSIRVFRFQASAAIRNTLSLIPLAVSSAWRRASSEDLAFSRATMRTFIYDGFNLYYGDLKETSWKWLDLVALFEKVQQPHHEILTIEYFTARVSDTLGDQSKPQRQGRMSSCPLALPTAG